MTEEKTTAPQPEQKPSPTPAADETPAAPPTPAVETGAAPEVPTPEPQPKQPKDPSGARYGYYWGTGRRKTSVARVRVKPGDGKFVINKREANQFFCIKKDQEAIIAPLKAADAMKRVDVFVNVRGGGISGQAGAIVLGVARALCKFNPDYEQLLRDGNYMTRDAREVERKKYGQRGARRRFQFSKR